MQQEIAGGDCKFLIPKSTLRLRTIVFESCASCCHKENLHSHLGENFTLDWAINMYRSNLWEVPFTFITDYYTLRFILSYDGINAVLLRQQMCLQLWAINLCHRPGKSYAGWLHVSYWRQPLFQRDDANLPNDTINLRKHFTPTSGTMLPEKIPGYRAPRVWSTLDPVDPAVPVDDAIDTAVP